MARSIDQLPISSLLRSCISDTSISRLALLTGGNIAFSLAHGVVGPVWVPHQQRFGGEGRLPVVVCSPLSYSSACNLYIFPFPRLFLTFFFATTKRYSRLLSFYGWICMEITRPTLRSLLPNVLYEFAGRWESYG